MYKLNAVLVKLYIWFYYEIYYKACESVLPGIMFVLIDSLRLKS